MTLENSNQDRDVNEITDNVQREQGHEQIISDDGDFIISVEKIAPLGRPRGVLAE